MTEPVFVIRGFANDGSDEPQACVSQVPLGDRGAIYQHLTKSELKQFGDNLTLFWEGEFDGEGYDLIRPLTNREVEQMTPYRCDQTEDMFE